MKPSNFRRIKRMPYIRQGPKARPCGGVDVHRCYFVIGSRRGESRQPNFAMRKWVRFLRIRNGSTQYSFPPV